MIIGSCVITGDGDEEHTPLLVNPKDKANGMGYGAL